MTKSAGLAPSCIIRARKDSNFRTPSIFATMFQIEKCWRFGGFRQREAVHGDDPGLGVAGILDDADVGACPFAGEVNVLQGKELFAGTGASRGLHRSVKNHEVAL